MAHHFGGPLAEYLVDRIPAIGAQLNRDYSRIPAEDFEQAIWVRALERRDAFSKFFGEGKRWSIDRDLKEAGVKLLKEDDRYVRAQKAAESGYSIDDEQFYTTGMLAKIMPALIEADFNVSAAMERASGGPDAAGITVRSGDPHGGAEEYMAILIDVSTAYKRLTEGQRRTLRVYYRTDQEDTARGSQERQALAQSMGLTYAGLRSRVYQALLALQKQLGGPSPWS